MSVLRRLLEITRHARNKDVDVTTELQPKNDNVDDVQTHHNSS